MSSEGEALGIGAELGEEQSMVALSDLLKRVSGQLVRGHKQKHIKKMCFLFKENEWVPRQGIGEKINKRKSVGKVKKIKGKLTPPLWSPATKLHRERK